MQYLILLIRDIQLWKRTKRWIFRFSNCLIRRLIFNHPIVLVQNRVCFSWTLSAFSGSGDYYNCVSYLSMINTRCHTHLHARVCVCVYVQWWGLEKHTHTCSESSFRPCACECDVWLTLIWHFRVCGWAKKPIRISTKTFSFQLSNSSVKLAEQARLNSSP